MIEDDKLPHMHNVTFLEVQVVFIYFEECKLKFFQSLLRDYSSIVFLCSFPTSGVKSNQTSSRTVPLTCT